MEIEKSIDPAKIATLGVYRIVRKTDRNKKFSELLREFSSQKVFRILHSLINHLIGAQEGRVALLQGHGSGRPMLPIKLTTPGQLQQVAEQQSERIDLLAKLPIRDSGFSSKPFKPLCERFGRMIAQADIGMVRYIVFNMSSIPVFGLIRDPKKRQYLNILGPKTRNA
ncbi:MAG: hypothetical protein JAY82_14610, partial [Candidatus Thiodiazotropha taylori]|nr:hypothetical protein [Candidatus Thiodiazotropha taylori]